MTEHLFASGKLGRPGDLGALLTQWRHFVATEHAQLTNESFDGQAVATSPDPSLAALRANVTLVHELTNTQWLAMLVALETGAGWDDIAAATDTVRGTVWSTFCQQTDTLDQATPLARRARAIKDPYRGPRPA